MFWKMVEDVDHCLPKLRMTSLNVLFHPKTKDIQFIVIGKERNQKTFIFKKMKSENNE